MKLSEQTIKILNNYVTINNGICIRASKEDTGTFICTVALEGETYSNAVLPEKFEKDVYLYDLGLFLSSLKAFKDPDIILDDEFLTIVEGKSKLKIMYADPAVIVTKEKKPNLPEPVLEFSLSEQDIAKIQRFANMLSLPLISLANDADGNLTISTYDPDTKSTNSFSTEIGSSNCSTEFNLIFTVEHIKVIPADYDVSIYRRGDNTMAKFSQINSLQQLNYIIPCNPMSVWKE